ncbi:hypothetical protein Rhe02_59560 [Rhizocola hellebori]|uniref:Cation-transporting P-type ATPase N-terminal domain-containing protein n=1 Tax=Rhizocola hellebori TaxID=1392758 RepID=A0A8J3QBV1_9ACTN|nr:cation-transporting P-type ATPase [Rhizocola hellebori]GIH07889.1 hypothetical protein Rhe02_59560 [Rhizocola hellebori]
MAVLTENRPAGLSAKEAAARLAGDGPNAVAKPRPRRLLSRIGAQLTDPLVALLLAAAVVTTLRTLLGTEPLSASQVAVCAAVAVVPALVLWIWRNVRWGR